MTLAELSNLFWHESLVALATVQLQLLEKLFHGCPLGLVLAGLASFFPAVIALVRVDHPSEYTQDKRNAGN
jgi:hypothetical protein